MTGIPSVVVVVAAAIGRGLVFALVSAGLALPAAAASAGAPLAGPRRSTPLAVPVAATAQKPVPLRADFEHEEASPDARHIADWVLDSGDNRALAFVIVDKVDSKVFIFDARGRLRGATSALIGLARGDDSVPGIGSRKLSTIRPEERTTPAGRFVASLERSLHGDEILWVDYDAGVALHPVVSIPEEQRLERLVSPVAEDRRITYGCINVPVSFFKDLVRPLLRGTGGIVYVLPETRSSRAVFGSYAVDGDRNPAAARTVGSP